MPLSRDPEARGRQLANLRPGARTAPPGNRRAVSHGGYAAVARERLEAKARQVYDALAADAPLPGALNAVATRLLADCLCRLEDLAAHLRDRGLLTPEGEVRPAVELEAKLRREALDHAEALGMTPRSAARLGLDLARGFDLATADDDEEVPGA